MIVSQIALERNSNNRMDFERDELLSAAFLKPLQDEYSEKSSDVALFLRGKSGFAGDRLFMHFFIGII